MSESMIALVTGANRGIGLEVCRQFAQQGYTVLLGARELSKGQAAAAQLTAEGLAVRAVELDVTDPAGIERLRSQVEAEYGRLDVLINNAAGYADWMETASTAAFESVHQVFETTLFGTWRMCQAFLPLIRRSQHGRIVNVSSGAGSHGDPQFGLSSNAGRTAGYGVAKAAVNALTAKLAEELKGSGILVNAVCPGLTATYEGAEAMGARPIPQGAAGIVWAATLPDEGATGGFFRDGTPLPW